MFHTELSLDETRPSDGKQAAARVGAACCAAVEVGLLAHDVLRDFSTGRVAAVFERSFYATLDGNWICVGQRSIGSGPLHLLCDFGSLKPTVGEAVRVAGDVFRVAGRPFARLASASIWRPQVAPNWSTLSLVSGLHKIDEVWNDGLTSDGLAIVGSDRGPATASPLLQAAAPGLAALRRVVAGQSVDGTGLESLVGLGPGLTPSGDDLIGGALVALSALGRPDCRDRLWTCCAARLHLTNDISRAHLQAAAMGYGAAPLHAAIDATMGGRLAEIGPALAALRAVGHTSGLDGFAGSLMVLRMQAAIPAAGCPARLAG